MKAAIVILSDPKSGTEESLGRVFNALASAYDFQQNGDDLKILFQGAGTRWPGELDNPGHPAHALFATLKDEISGVSCGCADVFGSRADIEKSGYALITENAVPGTTGLPSLRRLASEGYTVLTF